MMTRWEQFKIIFLSVIICPELAILLTLPLMCTTFSRNISNVIAGVTLSPEKLKFIAFVPLTLLGLTLNDFRSVLQPEHSKKDILLQWPAYHLLKIAYFGGLLYQVIFSAIGLSVWLSSEGKLTVYFTAALIVSTIGSLVCYWTILLAKAKVQEKLARQ